ncbi:serine hydrolase [Terrabacter carboxydivorans]|uniref:Beta-lactamase n=1 Tax=Terrabacter carboxydivorans TaxID=619730 RepID=A0ABP5Z5I5_9MICO
MDLSGRASRRAFVLGSAGLALPATTVLGAGAASAAGIDTPAALRAALSSYLSTRVGTVGLLLHDHHTGQEVTYNTFRNQSLSTIKVLVLVALLRRSQERGLAVTTSQRALASKMIRYSDNAATDSLIAQVGSSTIVRVARDVGMSSTVVQTGSYGTSWWGYSTTIPADLVRLLRVVVISTGYLTTVNRAYVRQLMSTVTATQRWGVCDPPLPTDVYTIVKNGWGPLSGGYRVNSLGYVHGNNRWYSLAILSRSPNGFTYGRATVDAVSLLVYRALDVPLR